MIKTAFNSLGFRGLYRLGSYQALGVSGWAKVALKVSLVCGAVVCTALVLRRVGAALFNAVDVARHNATEFKKISDQHPEELEGYNILVADEKERLAVIEHDKTKWESKLIFQILKCSLQFKKVYMTLERDWIAPVHNAALKDGITKEQVNNPEGCNIRITDGKETLIIIEHGSPEWENKRDLAFANCNAQGKKVYTTWQKNWMFDKNATSAIFEQFQNSPEVLCKLRTVCSDWKEVVDGLSSYNKFWFLHLAKGAVANSSAASKFNCLFNVLEIDPRTKNIQAVENAIITYPRDPIELRDGVTKAEDLVRFAEAVPTPDNAKAAKAAIKAAVFPTLFNSLRVQLLIRVAAIDKNVIDAKDAIEVVYSNPEDKYQRADSLLEIFKITHEPVDLKAARDAIKEVENGIDRARLLAILAGITHEDDDINACRDSIKEIPRAYKRASLLIQLVKITREERDKAAAIETINMVENVIDRASLLIKLAGITLEVVDIKAARDAVSLVTNDYDEAGLLVELAEITLAEEDIKAARDFIMLTQQNVDRKANLLIRLATITFYDKDIEAAEMAIENTAKGRTQTKKFAELLKIAPTKKNVKTAEKAAASIEDTGDRVKAYTKLAAALKMHTSMKKGLHRHQLLQSKYAPKSTPVEVDIDDLL